MKRIVFGLIFAAVAAVCFGRDFSTAARLDSIDRELNAARNQLEVLDRDYYENIVWGRGRYTALGFSLWGNTDTRSLPRYNTSFGLSFSQGTSYLFPKGRGLGSFIKPGLDVRWVDVELMTYDSKMKRMSLLAGLCGIGPAVSIAPFSWTNNMMASFKIQIYGHYQPTFGLMAVRETAADRDDGDRIKRQKKESWSFESGYVHGIDFGVKLQWRRLAAGVEYRRGIGYRRTFSSTRLMIYYSF